MADLSMAFIVGSEEAVAGEAAEHPALKFGQNLRYRACDVLLGLLYGLGPQPDPESPAGVYHLYAFERCGECPYAIRAGDVLSSRGHYPEAVAVLRGLVESFVQLRYFAKHPEVLKTHLLATSAKDRVRFITMFDEFSPGFYGKVYGGLLSGIAHSGIALSALLPFQVPEEGQPAKSLGRVGCQFNLMPAAFVNNISIAITLGFLLQFSTFFPGATPTPALAIQLALLPPILEKHVAFTIKGEVHELFLKLIV